MMTTLEKVKRLEQYLAIDCVWGRTTLTNHKNIKKGLKHALKSS